MKALFLGVLFALVLNTSTDAAQIQTISTLQAANCLAEFDQAAPSLFVAQAFEYKVSINAGAQIVVPVTCSGTTSPFACNTPLPNKTVGTWTIAFTSAEILSDGTRLPSSLSTSYTYRIANPPSAPVNIRIILGAGLLNF